MISVFKKGKQTKFSKTLIGFDIETEGKNNDFVLASLNTKDWTKEFYSKGEFIFELIKKKYRNCLFVATNLSFDFFGTFFGGDIIQQFRFIHRGSDLICAKTYIYNGKFHAIRPNKNAFLIEFIDTMNFSRLSVEKLGLIVGAKKLKKPKVFQGNIKTSIVGKEFNIKFPDVRLPGTLEEWKELIEYNIRDSEISRKFLEFFIKGVRDLGGNFCKTIASCSKSIFRNKYLDMQLIPHDKDILIDLFKAYYGGRVEVFKRGYDMSSSYNKYKLYDINSLYPSVMKDNSYPDPRSLKVKNVNTLYYIFNTEGVSYVDIEASRKITMPLLPFKYEGKLTFPQGAFSGYYTHVELRKAVELGYFIKKVHKSIYYTEMCEPFKGFVNDLYVLRMKYQAENNPMEFVCKIIMNSLYGKFGERFDNKKELQPFNLTIEELSKIDKIERFGDYIYFNKKCEPASHCVPIWAIYTTAYARLKLYDYLVLNDPVYCDTDSIITHHTLETSTELGKMKLEHNIKEMIIIKPKFYSLKIENKLGTTCEIVKCKGLPHVLKFEVLKNRINIFNYTKFAKFRESIRRNLIPNQHLKVTKTLNYLDDKRDFIDDLNTDYLIPSIPVYIRDGIKLPTMQNLIEHELFFNEDIKEKYQKV